MDLELRATCRLWKGRSERPPAIYASFGTTLPTGSTDKTDSSGARAPDTMQPGQGTFDPLLSAFLIYPLKTDWYAYAGVDARLGVQENDYDYEFGDVIQTTVGGVYNRWSRLSGFAHLTWSHEGRNRQDGQTVPSTGGDFLYVSPGARLRLTDRFSIQLQDQILLSDHANGDQILPRHTVSAVVTFEF